MSEPIDLFARQVGDDQPSLFGVDEGRMQPPARTYAPDPETIRQRLNSLLDSARKSRVMPWPEHKARMWQTVFPQMANWLPEDEAVQLCFDFAKEIERLRAAACSRLWLRERSRSGDGLQPHTLPSVRRALGV